MVLLYSDFIIIKPIFLYLGGFLMQWDGDGNNWLHLCVWYYIIFTCVINAPCRRGSITKTHN